MKGESTEVSHLLLRRDEEKSSQEEVLPEFCLRMTGWTVLQFANKGRLKMHRCVCVGEDKGVCFWTHFEGLIQLENARDS